jgi:hypothetical protein
VGKSGRKNWTQCVLWDDVVSVLGLRISPTNRKSFVVSYRSGGRKRLKSLGKWGQLSLTDARKQAIDFLESQTETTPEPAVSPPAVETVRELSEAYLEYARSGKRNWRPDESRIHRYVIPVLGRIPLSEIEPTDVGSLRARIVSVFPAEGTAIGKVVRAIFEWGEREGALPWSTGRPTRKIRKPPRRKRKKRKAKRKAAPPPPVARIPPAPAPAPPPKPAADPRRYQHLRLLQPFDESAAARADILDLSPIRMEIETTSALQVGGTYPFEIRRGDRAVEVEAKVLACRLARMARTPLGGQQPLYRAKLVFTRELSPEPAAAWAALLKEEDD